MLLTIIWEYLLVWIVAAPFDHDDSVVETTQSWRHTGHRRNQRDSVLPNAANGPRARPRRVYSDRLIVDRVIRRRDRVVAHARRHLETRDNPCRCRPRRGEVAGTSVGDGGR